MGRVLGFVLCALTLLTGQLRAQEPRITVSSEQQEVTVGQAYLLRVEVLVPTFMPKAPVFPSFEVPGLIVRLPERSTAPISERIGGSTWAGVRRTYRIYPMRAGVTDIPQQEISIVYKDPETNEDVPLTTDVPATQIVATVPPGARGLDPLIVAKGVEITQSWQVAEGPLSVGDAVVRSLEIAVAGTSALFVPPLLEDAPPGGAGAAADSETAPAAFQPYPEDPQVTETFDRGVMSGTRREAVSYIAQTGGDADFPAIVVRWFNLDSEQVEEITLEGRAVSVVMPPQERAPVDRVAVARLVIGLALAGAVGWAAVRWLWPYAQPKIARRRAIYAASPQATQRRAEAAARAGDLDAVMQALTRLDAQGYPPPAAVSAALRHLTAARYRDGRNPQVGGAEWQALRRAIRAARPGRRQKTDPLRLAPLNPFS